MRTILRVSGVFLGSLFLSLGILPDPVFADSAFFSPSVDNSRYTNEFDVGVGFDAWSSSLSQSGLTGHENVPIDLIHLRYLLYKPQSLVFVVNFYYASALGNPATGSFSSCPGGACTTTPISESLGSIMNQLSLGLGYSASPLPEDSLNTWLSLGFHQQNLWATASPFGSQSGFAIPYLGVTLYNQYLIVPTRWVLFQEIGGRASAIAFPPGPSVAPNSSAFQLGLAWNAHALAGARYYLTKHFALYSDLSGSYWAFSGHIASYDSNENFHLSSSISSQTFWYGVELGVTANW
ncbi:MAG: hypothetical protein ACYCOU_15850 [Sulfobacillus sp.]